MKYAEYMIKEERFSFHVPHHVFRLGPDSLAFFQLGHERQCQLQSEIT